jgi:hypothetical protein
MKHFKRLARVVPVPGSVPKLAVLKNRKAGLESMIRERFRRSRREIGFDADVRDLSRALRKVKSEIQALGGLQKGLVK